MKICIIGWYGTETIGDRAILAGIISLISEVVDDFEVNLGSLHPFFSHRTVVEDSSFINKVTGKDINIKVFDSRRPSELKQAIKNSDLLIMGGGPLMDLDVMYLVEYAFKKAKRYRIKSMVFGCGVGPFRRPKIEKSLLSIVENASVSVFRDERAKENYEELASKHAKKKRETFVAPDPAIKAILDYKKHYPKPEIDEQLIAFNFRNVTAEYKSGKSPFEYIRENVVRLAESNPDKKMLLTPMHYFHVGGDDRRPMHQLLIDLKLENVEVQKEPLSLLQTMEVFSKAHYCIGMRYHSVVFQTFLNGRNFILNYTDRGTGKTDGFLQDMDLIKSFQNRMLYIQEPDTWQPIELDNLTQINIESLEEKVHFTPYIAQLKALLG